MSTTLCYTFAYDTVAPNVLESILWGLGCVYFTAWSDVNDDYFEMSIECSRGEAQRVENALVRYI